MDVYGSLYRSVIHPAWESVLRGRPTLARLEQLRRSEWRSKEELDAFQFGELTKLLRHAEAHVPYFGKLFAEAGVRARDVKTVDDMRKIPVLTRPLASSTLAERTSTAPPFPTIKKSTSGSSGNPLVFAYDTGSEYWRQAMKLRGYEWAGYRIGEPSLHYWGPAPRPLPPWHKRAKVGLDRAIKRETYLDCVTQNEEALRATVATIRKKKPKVILAYAQSGGALARFIVENRLRDWNDINVICGAEPLFPNDRAAMREAFGPGVFNTYGCRETMLIATECAEHDGLHVSMENILVEVIVKDEKGVERAAKPGEVGELVITDLHNFGAPLIRYVNGDLAMAGDETTCGCGRKLARISSVEGRVTEALTDGKGGRVSGIYFCTLMVPLATSIRRFQAVQHKDKSITLKIVPTAAYSDDVAKVLQSNVERALPGVPLAIQLVDSIPAAASGKGRPVVVER